VAVAAVVAGGGVWASQAVWASSSTLGSYGVWAQAPVAQVTQDDPTASFHPQGEGELLYAESDMGPARAHAFAAPFWPGAAVGNVGSLIGVLGYPPQPELNDPARAEVESGSQTDTATVGTGAATGSASVRTASGDEQDSEAEMTSGAGPVQGTAHTVLSLKPDGTVRGVATNTASDVSIAGVIHIGSITSSATLTSSGGGAPKGGTTMTVEDFTIAGQQAYVDGSGVHFGPPPKPGQPANPEAAALIDQALQASNIQLYFTAPRHVPLGDATYEYAASLLVFWQPPHDTNHDTMTASFGGAAVAMVASPGSAPLALPLPVGPAAPEAVTPAVADLTAAPSVAADAGGGTPPAPAVGTAPAPILRPAAVATPFRTGRGVPWGWVLLVGLGALAGAVLLPFVPALLAAGAGPVCDHERPITRS
jgi:hypothetical protein